MKFLVIFASVVLAISATTDQELWLQFQKTYGREYRNLREAQVRFTIFQQNLRKIEEHNAKYEAGEKSYYLGVTRFADKSEEEFRAMLNYSKAAKPTLEGARTYKLSGKQAASEVNWVTQGGRFRGQKSRRLWILLGLLYRVLEGQYAISTGNLVSLSEQNLMDCSTSYGNGGCDGGYMTAGYLYVQDNGIERESDYPYTAVNGYCSFQSLKSVMTISGFTAIQSGDENALLDAVENITTVGPISIGVNADNYPLYAGGVYDESCTDELNHGVLAVGYGEENGTPYWLVKNSWGAEWGENG
ncbi:hypothetical protein NQ317_007466 [Molorchus minor]|uniref:Uncharacterized protein n=1 Tax=Molorchus minor TaxID=1323400 RepID=A0ABQ9K311_9CUCU|nr:hypothetical protein NQ317_007466 [Molorchus minor]